MRILRSTMLALSLSVLVGCSSGPQATAEFTILAEVRDLLRAASGTGQPPTALADLDPYKTMYRNGYEAVKSGEVVVLWGTALKGEGEAAKDEVVVAYEKGVPTEGGTVLLSGGTIKKMTAAEFNAVPKATK